MLGIFWWNSSGSELLSQAADDASAVTDDSASSSAVESVDCSSLTDEAVGISEEKAAKAGHTALLKVRGLKVVRDNRQSYELPTDTSDALVLRCRGTGVWDDGTRSPVRIELTADSDGESWVYYQPL